MSRREKLFWLCAGAALIVLVISFIPGRYEICEVAEKAKEENCPAYRVLPFVVIKIGKIVDLTALGTLVIAAFTGTLWWSTRGMQRITIETIALARQEFIATHRPRVIVRYIQGPDFGDDGHQFICVTFVNIGINPATIEAFGGDLVRRDKQGHFLGGLQASPAAIAPVMLVSGERYFFTVKARRPYGDAEIAEDAFEDTELCAVGGIKYRDGNGVLRETAFFRVHAGADSFVISPKDVEMNYQD